MFLWIKNLHPGLQIAILLVGVFTAGGATTLSTVSALSQPRRNSLRLNRVDSIITLDHLYFNNKLTNLEDSQRDLTKRLEAQLCLSAAERDDSIPWQSCISPDLLRIFRGDN